MYEAKFLPPLKEIALSLGGTRYYLGYANGKPRSYYIEQPHIHRYRELFFPVSGQVSFLVGETLYSVAPGTVIFSRPSDVHVCIFPKDTVYEYFCLWVDAEEGSPLNAAWDAEPFLSFRSVEEEKANRLKDLFFSLNRVEREGKNALESTALLLQILLLLSENATGKTECVPLPAPLQAVLEDINENFATIKSMNDLLPRYFICASTLTRWFKKHLHTLPHKYLESKKLSHASLLLRQGASVTEACLSAGFSDCSHFISLFKRSYGVTPLQYQKEGAPKKLKTIPSIKKC